MTRTINLLTFGALLLNLATTAATGHWLPTVLAAVLAYSFGLLRYEDGRLDALGVVR
jgi:hypothetical protein